MAKQSSSRRTTPLRYDSYGRPLKNKKSNGALRFFFGFLIPYLVINGIILFLVITKPTVSAEEPDTTDYQNATLQFQVDSVLPMRSVTATLEGEEVPLSKNGKNYVAELNANGNLTISVESLNRMTDVEHVSINILDETGPEIDESSVILGAGYVEFQVSDSQSGVDFDGIYGVDGEGDTIKPTDINRSQGIITFSMKDAVLNVYVQDLAGNEQTATFSIS